MAIKLFGWIKKEAQKKEVEPLAEQNNQEALNKLLESLDKTRQELLQCDLEPEAIAKYTDMLSAMMAELNGVSTFEAIPELLSVLNTLAAETFPKVFHFCQSEHIDAVKEVAFDAIKALLREKKEQEVAVLDLLIYCMKSNIWENEYKGSMYEVERRIKRKELAERPDDEALEVEIAGLGTTINSLKQRTLNTKTEIGRLVAQKRNLETDAQGCSFFEAHRAAKAFLAKLPSIEVLTKAIEDIQSIGDRNLAILKSENAMLSRVLVDYDDDRTTATEKDSTGVGVPGDEQSVITQPRMCPGITGVQIEA